MSKEKQPLCCQRWPGCTVRSPYKCGKKEVSGFYFLHLWFIPNPLVFKSTFQSLLNIHRIIMIFSTLLPLAIFAGLAASAPVNGTSNGNPYILVKNNCDYKLTVGESQNGNMYGTSVEVDAGASHTFTFQANWAGRVWGRRSCSGKTCKYAGMWAPATLAEVFFEKGNADWYDISLVDGYNEPMTLEPINPEMSVSGSQCGAPTCSKSPDCPSELVLKDDNGNVIGCEVLWICYHLS